MNLSLMTLLLVFYRVPGLFYNSPYESTVVRFFISVSKGMDKMPGMMVHVFNPGTWQEDLCELGASLVYITSFRPVKATW